MGTPRTEAANLYHKRHCKKYCLCLNKGTDADVIAKIEAQESKQGYIKELIRRDIAKEDSDVGQADEA